MEISERIRIETSIIRDALNALEVGGYTFRTAGVGHPAGHLSSLEECLSDCLSVDEAEVVVWDGVSKNRRRVGVIRFVRGNGGFDVIYDYSWSLAPILDPVCDSAMAEEEAYQESKEGK